MAKILRRHRLLGIIVGIAAAVLLLRVIIPKPDIYSQYTFSSAVYDRKGKLLKLALTMDDKYRLFVPYEDIPQVTEQALLLYEDREFYHHFGLNPLSMLSAMAQMATGGRKRGASTITMQLARIVYHIDSSNIVGKIEQILRALQIEMFYSKKQILEAYFNLAPYGGNIEGIGAAALIYFNTPADKLNLLQSIALTVIPQNPNQRQLFSAQGRKNNTAATARLKQMWLEKFEHPENQYLNLPLSSGVYLPDHAPHLSRRLMNNNHGNIISTIDLNYQQQAEQIMHQYIKSRRKDGIYNAAAVIVDARSMEVLAYIGSDNFYDDQIQGQVDGITALRSPGSALKPFIYALALQKGIIHPLTMLKDVPRNYGLYTPENFDRSFYGLIDATQALIHSRNIPAVDLLLKVGESDFYDLLKKGGVQKLRPVDFYGLAMALGGAEISPEKMAVLYAMLYNGGKVEPLHLVRDEERKSQTALSPEAAFLTLDMLAQNKAIDDFSTSFSAAAQHYPIAWKTGTSYGFKDAWTAGIVGPFVIVVWVGNFDAAPNNAFVGREAAAPLFFRLARNLGRQNKIPETLQPDEMLNLAKVKICRETGDIADAYCPDTVESYFIPGVSSIKISKIARLIPIDVESGLRACRHTPPTTVLQRYNFWPSDVLQAFAQVGINIRRPPEFKQNCDTVEALNQGKAPQIVLPADGSKFMLRSKQYKQEKIALKATTDADVSEIYWFVDNALVGKADADKIFEINPPLGKSEIKAVDEFGRSHAINIEVNLID